MGKLGEAGLAATAGPARTLGMEGECRASQERSWGLPAGGAGGDSPGGDAPLPGSISSSSLLQTRPTRTESPTPGMIKPGRGFLSCFRGKEPALGPPNAPPFLLLSPPPPFQGRGRGQSRQMAERTGGGGFVGSGLGWGTVAGDRDDQRSGG